MNLLRPLKQRTDLAQSGGRPSPVRSLVIGALVILSIWSVAPRGEKSSNPPSSSFRITNQQKAPLEIDHYKPCDAERYVLENGARLGLKGEDPDNLPSTCGFWNIENEKFSPNLQLYRSELKTYKKRLLEFSRVPDLRLALRSMSDKNSWRQQKDICRQVELHKDGLTALFPSGLLSEGPFGKIEPLLPPLRHPEACYELDQYKMDLTYLVHDFGAICRRLTPYTRNIFIDMGASLTFHDGELKPAVFITELYEKFGFPFDHIYAFEITQAEPSKVYELLPEKLMPAYHWINVGVSADPQSRFNPLKMVLENFNEDDLVVVKLDIDTPFIEVPLFQQILEDDRFSKLIDQVYFEHHVLLQELAPDWKGTMKGTVEESLNLFHGVRAKGIAVHYWV